MRIHYLINGFNGGGAALPIPDLVGLMRRRGHEVKVFGLMLQDGKARSKLEKAEIDYEVLGRGKGDLLGSWTRLIKCLRRDSPDLIWTSLTRATLFGQAAGKMLGIPVVSWQHSAFLKRSNLFLLRCTKSLSWRWVTDSENVREFTIKTLGIRPDQVSIWPMFQVLPDAPVARAWSGDGPMRIGSLGRLHANKKYDCLVRVAARLQKTRPELAGRIEFVVGGVGPERGNLEALIEKLGVRNFSLVGYIDSPPDFLKELHIYIQTSHHEGLCIAAHEAMQAALPVIATRVGQLRHSIIDGETGLLCEVGDVSALAASVESLVQNPAMAHAMGVAAHRRVTSLFSPAAFRESGDELLHHLESGLSATRRA